MSNSNHDKWIFYGLLALIFWLPIPLGSNRPWAWTILEIYSFSLLIGWIILCASQYDFRQLKPYRSLLLTFILVQLWVFIQQVSIPLDWLEFIAPNQAELFRLSGAESGSLSLDPSYTFIQWVLGCSYVCILFLTLVLTNSEKRLNQLVLVMVMAGIFQALYGTFLVLSKSEYLFFENTRWQGIATGSFMYRNHFANFLLLTLSLGIGLMVAHLASSKSHSVKLAIADAIDKLFSPKALIRISLILMVIALVMTRSRMGNTAFFVAMTACSIFALLFMKRKTRALIWLFGSMLVIDIFIVSSLFGLEKVQQRIQQTSVEQETRDDVVLDAIELIPQFPITGTGAGSFYSTFQLVQGPGIFRFYDFAHNEYLQFTIEYGIPITLLLASMILASLWQAQRALRKRNRNLMRGVGFAAMMAIIGQLIHISVDFPLQIPANTIYFIIILAMAWMANHIPADLQRKSQIQWSD